jgi:hypothetical protein
MPIEMTNKLFTAITASFAPLKFAQLGVGLYLSRFDRATLFCGFRVSLFCVFGLALAAPLDCKMRNKLFATIRTNFISVGRFHCSTSCSPLQTLQCQPIVALHSSGRPKA